MTAVPVLVVVGMRREAALLPPGGVAAVLCTGGDPRRAERLLEAWAGGADGPHPAVRGMLPAPQARERETQDRHRDSRSHGVGEGRGEGAPAAAVLSFGIAGALDPALRPGDLVVATEIRAAGGTSHPADPAWSAVLAAATGARRGALAGADAVAADPAAKRALRAATGALAVDLESAPAAAFAAARGLPFAALRAVADTAAERIPRAALVGLTPDGRDNPIAVLRALARRPADLPDLLRVAARSRAALAALARAVALLGRDLGRPGLLALAALLLLGHGLLDMA